MPDRMDRPVHVIMARPETGPNELPACPQPVGITAEIRAAKRACKALNLGPTGYCDAYYVTLRYITLPDIPGMRVGYGLLQEEIEKTRQEDLRERRGGRPGYADNRAVERRNAVG